MQHDEYDLAEAFERIEYELMSSMIRNMDRHRAEETEEGYNLSLIHISQFDAKPVPPTNEPQSSELRSITEDPEKQVDVNSEDCEESDDASSAEITDLQLLRDMLERKKRLLATNLAIPGIDESDEHIRMQKLEVSALASAVCDLCLLYTS